MARKRKENVAPITTPEVVEVSFTNRQRFDELAAYINANEASFTAGNPAPMDTILHILGLQRPVTYSVDYRTTIKQAKQFEGSLRRWQNKINRLLAYRGLYMSMSLEDDAFWLKSEVKTVKKVQGFYKDSMQKARRGNQLGHGVVSYRSAIAGVSFTPTEVDNAYRNKISY